jgi:hypothetical protein
VRGIFEDTNADHLLHIIEATDEQCLANIHRRNEEKTPGIYSGYVSDETFHAVTAHFQPPREDERYTGGLEPSRHVSCTPVGESRLDCRDFCPVPEAERDAWDLRR